MKKKNKIKVAILGGIIISVAAICILLLYNGILWFNNPSKTKFPVRGIDVSAYQGVIDWTVLSKQGIHFAYIKATEGSSFVDEKFMANFENAQKTNLLIGAYHFFSYDSSGLTQAENFISVVPRIEKMLPPVVDIEFYGDREKNPLSKTDTQVILTVLLNKLENYYGIRPIIYATQGMYESSSYSIRIMDKEEREYLGERLVEADGLLGRYRIEIMFYDAKGSPALAKEYPLGTVHEINDVSVGLKSKYKIRIAYPPDDSKFVIYIGSDEPINVKEQESKRIGSRKGNIELILEN